MRWKGKFRIKMVKKWHFHVKKNDKSQENIRKLRKKIAIFCERRDKIVESIKHVIFGNENYSARISD